MLLRAAEKRVKFLNKFEEKSIPEQEFKAECPILSLENKLHMDFRFGCQWIKLFQYVSIHRWIDQKS